MSKKQQKITAFIIWLLVFAIAIFFYFKLGISIKEYPKYIEEFLVKFGIWVPVVFVLLFIVRSIIMFPATIFLVLSGVLFGPIYGIIYSLIAENLSANLSFIIGRYFGKNLVSKVELKNVHISNVSCKFRDNGFISVLVMRLIFFPFDVIGYMSGACNLRQKDFALGTAIGVIPGVFSLTLLGGSFTNPISLLIATTVFVGGLILSKYLKKRNS